MPAEECTSAALDLSEPQFPQLGNWANNLHPTLVARAGSGQSPWHRVSICWIFNSYFSVRDDPSTGIEKETGLASGRGSRRCKGWQVRIIQETAKWCITVRTGTWGKLGTGTRREENAGG